MAKEKRSFFERLTGSISLGSDDDFDFNNEEPARDPKTWTEPEPEPEGELAIDLYQTPNELVIQTMVAGVKPDDLQITIMRERVIIKGSRERGATIDQSDFLVKELYWGNFSRTIELPAEIETEEAEATERYGLLTIRLPKIDKERTQRIKVRSL